MRLEKVKAKSGNEVWKVVEVSSAIHGLKVGDTSPLDMRSFPNWLREAAEPHFTKRGGDFYERLED